MRYGDGVIALLCWISLSPRSCVRQTANLFERWGPAALLIAKLVPGFGILASVLAGATRLRPSTFFAFDAFGSTLWIASAIYLGFGFSGGIGELLGALKRVGLVNVLLFSSVMALYLANKFWRRKRLIRSLRMTRISVRELHDLIQQGKHPLILDVRPPELQRSGRIPGAIAIPSDFSLDAQPVNFFGAEVVVYCACPDEASAARVAKKLMKLGMPEYVLLAEEFVLGATRAIRWKSEVAWHFAFEHKKR